ncbi:WD40 repeat domain-containing protein [Luteolibacter pohnpeiensis]|uniref:WD40 repeat domain-containing protein n=1 Tax=Luteolibacter pohnpeiensis TaxID=454153 RepID=A0A934S727_9BACT|nr:WD40 repeat domain-containing protein [Luteolibacter pohnpeiensis]MBK1883412.1 WD40 repeat domain-containing protein [Luteolibacter pohnpeiensis]
MSSRVNDLQFKTFRRAAVTAGALLCATLATCNKSTPRSPKSAKPEKSAQSSASAAKPLGTAPGTELPPVDAASTNPQQDDNQESAKALAADLIDSAEDSPADEALALNFAAFRLDPGNVQARRNLIMLLTKIQWYFPKAKIQHQIPIEHLAIANGSLWVSLSQGRQRDELNTTVRWDAISWSMRAELFPVHGASTSSLTVSPNGKYLVVQRGSGDHAVTLLCDAWTMEPIRDLGSLPDHTNPSSVLVFSPDDLLLARPEADHLTWDICDSATGEVFRSEKLNSPAVAARLDRSGLQLLMPDASVTQISLTPNEQISNLPAPYPAKILQGVYLLGKSQPALLLDQGANLPRKLAIKDRTDLLAIPWSRQSSVWANLVPSKDSPLTVQKTTTFFNGANRSPIRSSGEVTALAFEGNKAYVGTRSGMLEIYTLLPATKNEPSGIDAPEPPDTESISALGSICSALCGLEFREQDSMLHPLNDDERYQRLSIIRTTELKKVLPEIDFGDVLNAVAGDPPIGLPADVTKPLWDRLNRSKWVGHEIEEDSSSQPPSTDPLKVVRELFESGDKDQILSYLEQSPKKGPVAAEALRLAMKSNESAIISACVQRAEDLPPLLQRLAASRIGILEKRLPEVISLWPNGVPRYDKIRMVQNWDGWEQVDFEAAFDQLQSTLDQELAPLSLPEDPTVEQMHQLAKRLLSPETLAQVGRKTLAVACSDAAYTMAKLRDTADEANQIANLALKLGADPAPCIRSQATALTTLEHYQDAHEAWISLITDYPAEAHVPHDFTEAAYSAFQLGKGKQAMNILGKGMSEFPQNADYALQSGWIALLTERPEFAYDFLLVGLAAGYADDSQENALALLAISAAQSGYPEEAQRHFQELVELNPDWKDPATLETLNWPDGLKATLRQLTW